MAILREWKHWPLDPGPLWSQVLKINHIISWISNIICVDDNNKRHVSNIKMSNATYWHAQKNVSCHSSSFVCWSKSWENTFGSIIAERNCAQMFQFSNRSCLFLLIVCTLHIYCIKRRHNNKGFWSQQRFSLLLLSLSLPLSNDKIAYRYRALF